VQLEPAGGKKKASKLSGLEPPPSPSLKLVVRYRDTSFKWGPSGFDKRIFCQSSCARDLGFFPLEDFGVLDGMDHLVDEWNQMRFKNSAPHFMSLSSLERRDGIPSWKDASFGRLFELIKIENPEI
jgi:hypothetical protein